MASHSLPSFFKVLIDPSAPQLPLPPDFVNKHLKNKIPKEPIILYAKGGYSWKLKIEKVGHFYCFTHGWRNVVKDVYLCYGDFLVFNQVDYATFKVEMLGKNGCKKNLPQKIKVAHDTSGDPSFIVSIISNNGILRLPRDFTEITGISIDRERMIIVKSLDGKEWPMRLLSVKTNQKKTYALSSGWSNFRQSNNLCEGDECEFTFIKREDKLALAKVIKKKPRKRGRPRKQQI